MVSMNYLDLKEYEKRQKRSLGARLVSVRAEMVILAGSKCRIHRAFVDAPDSGKYAQLGWILDQDIKTCMVCNESFGIMKYRHHCRCCGNVVCSTCSPNVTSIVELSIGSPQRVCDMCYWEQDEVHALGIEVSAVAPIPSERASSTTVIPSISSKRPSWIAGSRENSIDASPAFTPTAAFVLKTTTNDKKKVFINVCHSDVVPMTDPNTMGTYSLSNAYLLARGPRVTRDNKNIPSDVYDVIVCKRVISLLSKDETEIFCNIIFDFIETKYSISLKKVMNIPAIAGNYKDGPIKSTTLEELRASPLFTRMKSNTPFASLDIARVDSSYIERGVEHSVLKFAPGVVVKTKRANDGSKVFVNVMRGKTEIVPESVLVGNPSFRFCNESSSVLVLASTTYPTSHSDDGSYLVFDVIISEATLKAVEVKPEYSQMIFKSILDYVSATFSIAFTTEFSFPKVKGMYKRPSENSSALLDQLLVPEYAGIDKKASCSVQEILEWLESTSSILPDPVKMSIDGVLHKLSNNKILGRHWVKHEFTIVDGVLDYYNQNKKKGNINLAGCIVSHADEGQYLEPMGSYPFVVQSREADGGVPKWELILAGSSEIERDSWIDVIRECSHASARERRSFSRHSSLETL